MISSLFSIYGVNLFLHIVLLSFIAIAAISCFRNPYTRSISALTGIIAISIIPWMSATQAPTVGTVMELPIVSSQDSYSLAKPTMTRLESDGMIIQNISYPSRQEDETSFPYLLTLLSLIWGIGFTLQMTRHLTARRRVSHWKSTLRQASNHELQIVSKQSLPLAHKCRILISKSRTSPCVTGFFKTSLIIPENLLAQDQHRELNWALKHELAHVKSHDLKWLALCNSLRALFWWNPAIKYLVRVWEDAREQICDQVAITDQNDRAAYGKFLVTVSSQSANGTIMAMANCETFTRLKQRLHVLMINNTFAPRGRTFMAASAIVAILAGSCVSQVGISEKAPVVANKKEKIAPEKARIIKKGEFFSVRYRTILTESSKKIITDGQVLKPDEYQKMMHKLTTTKNDRFTAPLIKAPLKKRAQYNIIRNNIGEPQAHPIDDRNYKFSGIRIEQLAHLSGGKIQLNFKLAVNELRGVKYPKNGKDLKKVPWDKLHRIYAEKTGTLKPFETICFYFGEYAGYPDLGTEHLSAIITVDFVDAEGKPVKFAQ